MISISISVMWRLVGVLSFCFIVTYSLALTEQIKEDLDDTQIRDPQIVKIRNDVFAKAFEMGYFKSSRDTTKMADPQYMAKIPGSPIKYEWQSIVNTSVGFLDSDREYTSGLYKFWATVNSDESAVTNVKVEHILLQ